MLRNWTLRTRLIALVVALLAVTSIVIGGVMFLVLRNTLSAQFDLGVQNAAQRNAHPQGGLRYLVTGLDEGDVIGLFDTVSGNQGAFKAGSMDLKPLSASQVSQMAPPSTSGTDAGLYSAVISQRGEYRLAAVSATFNGEPVRLIVGAPLAQLHKQILGLLATIASIVIASILLAAFFGTLIIGRALRPLRRVAAVASNVAARPLDRGEVELSDRVPSHDTNPHTEVGKVGVALNSLLDSVGGALSARQASEAKLRAFVADASHELRTPLASIRGYAELTRRFGGELTEDVQHNIDRIESESKRMTALVEDLLLLARLDSQRELDVEEVDLSRLLVDVVSDAHAAGRDHLWDLELPDEPVVVQGDDARLHQVFTNLLANARVHTPAGTRVTVELRQPAGERVTVLVRDTGPGIPPELQPALFGRFVRGDSSRNRNTGSTGLGLSIVAAVVQAHHGTVTVVSEPGDTTFRVELPVHADAPTMLHPAVAVSA